MSLAAERSIASWSDRVVPGFLRTLEQRLQPDGLQSARFPATAALVLILALLAVYSLFRGFDAFEFVTGDALYSIHMLDYGILDFRPPPPNRIVPDIALHWLVNPFVDDPYQQKLLVGAIIFVVTSLGVGLSLGPLAFAAFSAIMLSNGLGILVSATHYSLPLTVLLWLATRGTRLELPMLFVLTFSDPLILLPLAFVLVERQELRMHLARAVSIIAALAVNTLYSEFSATIVQIVALFPLWFACVWIARQLGLTRTAMVAICVLLPLASAFGFGTDRYTVPVAASLVLLLFPAQSWRIDWRYAVVPAVAIAIFLVTVDKRRMETVNAGYQCLVGELEARNIDTVAAGHWTAKPLYFAAKQAGIALTVTQTDFARNISHPWMAPRSFYGAPTTYAVRDSDTCTRIDNSDTYCGQAKLASVAEVTPLCGMFELYRYETAVPARHASPDGKVEAILHNLNHYIETVATKLR